jgi:CubicO group peptidase (beta-lactamase class C family)
MTAAGPRTDPPASAPPRGRRVRVPAHLDGLVSSSPSREAAAEDVGMHPDGVRAIWTAAEGLYRTGLHPALALCVRRHGRVVLDRAIGHVRGNGPGDPPDEEPVLATPDTPFCIFSVSKSVTAMLIHLLDERDLIRLDDAVAEYVPEFAQHGKRRITIRHVLTHRAGIPSVPGDSADLDLIADWDRIVARLCESKPVFYAGRRLAYHAITGGYVLGEIARRVTGKDLRTLLREEISEPLGLRWFGYGVRPEEIPEVARSYFTGRRVPPLLAPLVRRALGVPFELAAEWSNDPRYLTSIVPSGNVVATASELSTFFQVLLDHGELDGLRLFAPRTVRRALTESAYLEADLTLALPLHYGLGFMLGSPMLSLFGPHTPHAFGHYGFINVLGWADPDRDITVGLLTSGKPFVGVHLLHLYDLLRAISEVCPAEPHHR